MDASVGNPLIVAGIDPVHNIIMPKVPNFPEISANTPNFSGNLAILDFQNWQIFRKIAGSGFRRNREIFRKIAGSGFRRNREIFPKIGAFGTSLTHWGFISGCCIEAHS